MKGYMMITQIEDCSTVQEYLLTNVLNITVSADEDDQCYYASSVDHPMVLPCKGKTIDGAVRGFIRGFARHNLLEV